ncbi:MAG: hypothetical protein HUJ95_05955, partial [Bacteroidales bacterium]|nr:hypothetical protein [Bacteroidales bacterium]
IESEIATVNTRITTEVAAINTKIDAILGRLDSIEDRLEAIEEQINSIQSIELIPDYSDGTTSFYKAWDWDGEAAAFAKIKLEVTPASAADAIAQAFAQDPTTIKVDAVQTKSILTPITVKDVEKIEDGIILVTAESTDESLLNNGQNHSARVKVTVGAASASSSYFSFRKNTIAISLGTTDITLSSAKTSCEVNPVSDWTIEEWGVCYSYEQTPTTLHNKIVASSTSVLNEEFIFTDLTKDTDYYYRPYVKCNDSYYFGETVAFKTLLVIPDAVIKTAAEFKDMIENKLAQGGYYRIDADIDMTGVDFDNSVNPMKSFTIDGNGHTVTGLSKAMIEGVSQGDPEFVFKNITVKNPQIAMTSGGAAAFIGWLETKPFVTFENCKVEGGKISTTGSYAAAFYGYAAGYNVLDNGPVFTDITIKNCTVSGVEIEANKSVGAICGHATGNAWTKVTIDGCTVENNTLTTKQNTHVYVGAVLGTVGAGQTNQGKDGGVWISNCTVEGNTVAWNGGTDPAQRWYGRQGTPGGVLFIDGVCPYLVKNADNSYTIENGHQLAYLASEGFNMGVNPIVLNFPANAIIDMKGISYGHGDNTTNIPAKVVING